MSDVLRQALSRPAVPIDAAGVTTAAVAAILDHQDQMLFVVRAARQGDPWSGQVAFPGGHRDPTDQDLLETAIRETREEVGLHLDRAHFLGALDDQSTVNQNLPSRIIRPHVFRVPSFGELTLQPSEVADVRIWPLARLLDNDTRGDFLFDYRGHSMTLPCVDLDGARLWGLTLRFVDQLLHRIDGGGVGLGRL